MEIHEGNMMNHGQVSKGKLFFYFDFQILFALNHGAVGALVVTSSETAEFWTMVHLSK